MLSFLMLHLVSYLMLSCPFQLMTVSKLILHSKKLDKFKLQEILYYTLWFHLHTFY